MSESRLANVAVVGGGIVGLAHALACARAGWNVTLFERTERAIGASIRNFGLVWPVGQPLGPAFERAMRSREVWLEAVRDTGMYHQPTGSLHLAQHPDELAVLEEFVAEAGPASGARLLTAAETRSRTPVKLAGNVIGALWSPTEIMVDPREAIRVLPDWLASTHGVNLRFGETVRSIGDGRLETAADEFRFEHAFVCGGADFETLYPEVHRNSGLRKVKLQMLRTVPQPADWKLGPALCAGLTLTHYDAFKSCPSLPALRRRLERDHPVQMANGIHLLVSQTRFGEITLGDSHHTDTTHEPFDSEEVNRAILDYLASFARLPEPRIQERWHGVYAKLPGHTEFIARPDPTVTIVNGLGGAGMTLSFGLGEENVATTLGRRSSSPVTTAG